MLANVTGISLENLSTAHWAVAERLFACEINFRDRLLGFSFFLRFRLALLEFEADVFLVVQNQERFERSALAGNKPLKQIRFAGREQFLHLLAFDGSLQDDFARS